ncbi:hypothetical protein HZA73_03140 [candidate division TA06 bacterium]|nr:hypothetical protein [candidate division TA06 bacterium]
MTDTTSKSIVSRKLRKSARKAFFLSLLVPGSGEYYAGQKGYTKGFVAAEAVIWSAAWYNNYQGNMRRRDYIAYAAQKAGSNSGRDDDFYYQNVYEWPNSYWYNEDQWRQARELYPYDPAAQQAYVSDKLYSPEDSWAWQNYDQWYYYRGLRVRSRNYLHRISYSVGASFLNHMLSAVNAARLAKRFNKQRTKLTQGPDWRMECYSYQPETITLTFSRSF